MVLVKEKNDIDDDENGIFLQNVDVDGVQICEKEGRGMVYVYYCEIPMLIEKLLYYKKEYYDK